MYFLQKYVGSNGKLKYMLIDRKPTKNMFRFGKVYLMVNGLFNVKT